jgi:hypothetical protein
MPSDVPFEGSFYLELPEGFILDEEATSLTDLLSGSYELIITQINENTWLFTIVPASLRSYRNVEYIDILNIVYNISESIDAGSYNATITGFEFDFEDGTMISADEITVPVTVNGDYVGIHNPGLKQVNVNIKDNYLHIDSPYEEIIRIYSANGILLYTQEKSKGEVYFNINTVKDNILVVTGSYGWVRKMMVFKRLNK